MKANARPTLRRLAIALSLAALFVACTATVGAAAKPGLKAPKSGPWKVIAAENTPDGVKVLGGVVGGFTVSAKGAVKGFHVAFTEGGESVGCAGGEGFEGKSEGKHGVVKFGAGGSAPIVKGAGQWVVANGAGAVGGGTLQPAEVPLRTPGNSSDSGSIYMTLASVKKVKLGGGITWRGGECGLAFVVKPG